MAQLFWGFQGRPRKGNGQFPGFCHPSERMLSVKPGAGNGTTQTNRSSVPGMLTLNLFPTILVPNDLGVVAKGGAMIWWRVTCLWMRAISSLHVLQHALVNQTEGRAWEMAENWRPQGRLARHPSMRSRDWKLSCCNYRLWNRCGTH